MDDEQISQTQETESGGSTQQQAPEAPKFTEDDIRELMEYREGRHKSQIEAMREFAKEAAQELSRYQVPGMNITLLDLYRQLVKGGGVPTASPTGYMPTNPLDDIRGRLDRIEQLYAAIQGQALEQRFEAAIANRDWATDPALKEFAARYVVEQMRHDEQAGRLKQLNEYVAAFDNLVDKFAQRRVQRLAPKEKPPMARVPGRPEIPEPGHAQKMEDELEAIIREIEAGAQ